MSETRVLVQFPISLLSARLPAPPRRLLGIGKELERYFLRLQQQGYDVQCVSLTDLVPADPQPSSDGDTISSYLLLENLLASTAHCDVIVVMQHIDPLVIFNLILDRLPIAGDVFLIDQFAPAHDQSCPDPRFGFREILVLAERFGLTAIECIDVPSKKADSLTDGLELPSLVLNDDLRNLDLATQSPQALTAGQSIFVDEKNVHGLALLHLRKTKMPKWRIRDVEKAHIGEMLELFKKTFHHDMTPALWEWKYGANTARAVGIWENGQLIAHYGGMARQILYFGKPQTAVQIGDVMVDPVKRGTLTKKGPVFLMMATFIERYVGFGKHYFIGYGFPNDRAMKVAELLGLYAEVGHMVEFSWQPRKRRPLWATRLQLLSRISTDTEKKAIDACWQRMAADLRHDIVGIRDWRYLEHRYLNHPAHDYQVFLIQNRLSGKVRGIFVLRFVPEGCELMDCVAALSDIPLLITHARRLTGMHGASRLFCRITANFAHLFEVADASQQAVNIRIPANNWSHGPAAELIKDHWWLMSGDMDFR